MPPGLGPARRIQLKEDAVVVTVSSRHMDVTGPLKTFAEQKANKLVKYYDRIQEIEVVLDNSKGDKTNVEMIVNAEHKNMFIAHSDAGDAYASIDACVNNLERQLSDHKKKYRNRKHPEGEDKRAMRESVADGGEAVGGGEA
jgi:putative sigma-54 modulation protein